MTPEKAKNPLGFAPISGLIAKYAIPSVISMLVAAAYNITDQIFIGHIVGMLGNAATNVAFPVTVLCGAFAQLIGVGTATNFNIKMGAKKEEEAAGFLGVGLTALVFTGLVFTCVVFLFRNPLLLLCGATDNVFPLASSYLGITALGLPFFLFSQSCSHLIRADGSPAYSLIAVASGAILNVFLDWLFMVVFGWGIQGAATATVIGQFVSFAICALYFKGFKSFKIKPAIFGIRLSFLSQIVKLGTSNFINHLIMATVNIVMNNTLKYYGALSSYGSDIPLAVSGVIAKLNAILIAFSVGIALGCQPIFGFNTGAKNYKRVKEAYKKALALTFVINILGFLSFQLFPRAIISIFGGGSEAYLEFGENYLRIYMMMVCMFGVQPLSVNYFTASGKARQGIVLSLSRQGLFLLPLLILLPMIFGITGVLYAGPIADGLAVVLSVVLVAFDFKRMNALELGV
ncbi:MATE efflux family protein [Treponema primitia ZAS-2]|uniref:Multidrug export protein MepA n=1 Tax=Treponema primitia (strain ATCC BAA-887 / DSM 12427 / ZAS-2) TaxID=545694 RepID=F5YRI2_TREPZ|nr:MATE family efflux transporter [Treponema primitia]AEF83908.1 MATE efflux family protein [Treponema primitia ZAS-2]